LNDSVGRVELTRLLYNLFCHVEVDEAQDRDTKNVINQVIKDVQGWELNRLYTNKVATGRASTDDPDDTDGGGSHGELRAHGYKVRPDVIVGYDGVALEPLYKVWHPFPTYKQF
jgi:hypothetical protein